MNASGATRILVIRRDNIGDLVCTTPLLRALRAQLPAARIVVLDRSSGETFSEDIGDDNPTAIYVPGIHAHGYEALTDCVFAYLVTEEYDRDDPDEHGVRWDDERVRHLWSTTSPVLSARDASS